MLSFWLVSYTDVRTLQTENIIGYWGHQEKRSDSDVKADSDSQRRPRHHGNTAALIDAFTAGAEAADHTIARFDLAALDIHGCRGCLGGGRDPRHPCVQRDGMDAVYPAYMAADVVVLASPMYYWSISGQLKCAFDRLFAVAELGPDLANPVKDAVLLMAAEGDTEENFAPVRAYYKALLDCLGWKDAGIVYAGGNMAAGDIEAHPEQLEAARQLGAAL